VDQRETESCRTGARVELLVTLEWIVQTEHVTLGLQRYRKILSSAVQAASSKWSQGRLTVECDGYLVLDLRAL